MRKRGQDPSIIKKNDLTDSIWRKQKKERETKQERKRTCTLTKDMQVRKYQNTYKNKLTTDKDKVSIVQYYGAHECISVVVMNFSFMSDKSV